MGNQSPGGLGPKRIGLQKRCPVTIPIHLSDMSKIYWAPARARRHCRGAVGERQSCFLWPFKKLLIGSGPDSM